MTVTARRWRAAGSRLLAACGLAAALLVGTPVAALAHGDPASHYLESDVLYPAFGDRPTAQTELRLLGLLHAAEIAGYPLGVALVATEADLTDDASMLQRPQDYAEYVVAQLGLSRARPVLVITPAGYGLAGAAAAADGRAHLVTRPEAARLIGSLPPVGAGGEGLAESALGAVRLLAAESGHPLPAVVAPARPLQSSSAITASTGSRFDWRLPAGVFVGGDGLCGRSLRGAAPGRRHRRTCDRGPSPRNRLVQSGVKGASRSAIPASGPRQRPLSNGAGLRTPWKA